MVNLSKPSVYKIVEHYNKEGSSAIKYSKRGGRRRFLLTHEEETELLDSIKDKAEKGLIKTANDIKTLVEQKVGKPVSDDFIWDLLKRNGWKKKMPRPHHPKRKQSEQQEFKKNSVTVWMPSNGE
jgi:transposase